MPRTYSYAARWPEISEMIQRFRIKPEREAEFKRTAEGIVKDKEHYLDIERDSSVPYPLIGVLHERESSRRWDTYLGNGQKFTMRTTIEPKGRGPFRNFKEGALDALEYDGLTKVHQPDDRWELGKFWGSWPIEKMIFKGEAYNGLGYWYKGVPSPYVWGGSNIQVRGKYVSDGNYDPTEWDTQPGIAPILWMIGALDPEINYLRET